MRPSPLFAPLPAVIVLLVHCAGGSSSNLGSGGLGGQGGSGGGAIGGGESSSGSGTTSGGGGTSGSGTTTGACSASSSGGTSGGSGTSSSGGASGSGGGTDGGEATGSSGGSGDCGTRTGMRGQTTRTLMVAGTSRTYVAYLPQSASATTALPFVYVFHGASQDGLDLFTMTQYSTLADSDGIAVVFPDGQGVSSITGVGALDPWNVSDNGAAVCGAGDLANNSTGSVDFEFMDAIKADVTQDQCLDAKHTFATGFSMGGYFTHHVACDRADIKAAAPHSGGTIASLSGCSTGHMPIIIFHGTSDALITSGCDDPNGTAQSGFPPSATLWAQKNGCQSTYSTIMETGSGGNNGQCYRL
jgi:poly(3-hydroxybutyrate) depolymerase